MNTNSELFVVNESRKMSRKLKLGLGVSATSVIVVAGTAFLLSEISVGGSKVVVGHAVPANQQLSIDNIDHSVWNRLLKKYVDQNGMVDYRGLKASRADMRSLQDYLSHLSAANPRAKASRNSRLAFWINAYNALTVKGILREYPTSSIRNHTAKVFGYNIWKDLKLNLGGDLYSLNDMEHKILRKMDDPRIHFAIVCASVGCPRLLNEAYTADRVDKQLQLNARDFFSRRQNFRHDVGNGRFYLSSILKWFGNDFGDSQATQIRRISSWLPTENARQAAVQNKVSVSFLEYDWSLNEQKR